MRRLIPCLLALLAAPAAACINDSGTHETERRFRDSYAEPAPRANALTARDAGPALGLGLLAAMGLAVVGGATALLVLGAQRRANQAGRARRRLRARAGAGQRPVVSDDGHPFNPPGA